MLNHFASYRFVGVQIAVEFEPPGLLTVCLYATAWFLWTAKISTAPWHYRTGRQAGWRGRCLHSRLQQLIVTCTSPKRREKAAKCRSAAVVRTLCRHRREQMLLCT